MTRRSAALVMLTALLGLVAAVVFGPLGAAASDRHEAVRVRIWLDRLESARTDLVEARQRLQQAEVALRDQRQRRYPRGEAREALRAGVDRARTELLEAEQALPELLEGARRVGVGPGLLRPYEELTSE